MATALHVTSAVPARRAANNAPRLAALLMESFELDESIKVTPRSAMAAPVLATVFSPGDPLSQWTIASLRAREAEVLDAQTHSAAIIADQTAVPRALNSPIASIYRRLLGDRSASPASGAEQREGPRHDEVQVEVDREAELVRLAAMVVASGFGVPTGSAYADGEFEGKVLQNVRLAADNIAPGKSVSGMVPTEMQAIVAAAIHSSTSAFLDGPGRSAIGTSAVPRHISDTAKTIPDGGKVATQFLENGRFSAAKFLDTTAGVSMQASQLMGATPMGMKLALISAAAQKASLIVQQVKSGVRDKHAEGRIQLGRPDANAATKQRLGDHHSVVNEDSPKPFGA